MKGKSNTMCIEIMIALIVATYPNSNNTYVIKNIAKNVCKYSEQRKLDPYLVLSVIKHESGFDRRAKSHTNDFGLMQVNGGIYKTRCSLLGIRCNIREGTRILAFWKKACKKHKHKSHWLRHYNWNNRRHHLRVLWITKAYKSNNNNMLRIIKTRKYMKLKLRYSCMNTMCGAKRLGEQNVVHKRRKKTSRHN